MRGLSTCKIVVITIGVISAVVGLVLLASYNTIFDAVLHSVYQVSEGKEVEEIWTDIPVPMTMRMYFFNITNAEEFLSGGAPNVTEVGPYAYREYHHKENVKYHSNLTVTYLQKRWWVWDQEASGNNREDDVLVVLNTIPVAAAFVVEDSQAALTGLNAAMERMKETATVVTTPGDFLFYGYQDPLLDFAQTTFNNSLPPGLATYDKFAWFYKRNNSVTYDGIYNMFTGERSIDEVGVIDRWNYGRETDYFESPCNEVKGSAGELWPPGLKKDHIQLFSSDLCMSVTLYYQKEIEDKYGMAGYRYWGSNMTFANASYMPENECYCIDDQCPPTGLLDAQTCRFGAPAFISFPHFLNADPQLVEQVNGLEPDPEKHSFHIDLLPDIGVPLSVAARMQINIKVKPYPGDGPLLNPGRIEILSEVPEVILPILWFEVTTAITEDLSDRLKIVEYFGNSPVPFVVLGLLLAAGVFAVVGACFLQARQRQKVYV